MQKQYAAKERSHFLIPGRTALDRPGEASPGGPWRPARMGVEIARDHHIGDKLLEIDTHAEP